MRFRFVPAFVDVKTIEHIVKKNNKTQLELRDVVRRGAEAETEAACLRERLRQVSKNKKRLCAMWATPHGACVGRSARRAGGKHRYE